jgi:UDP-2,3-diacylglucosamine hydrolase
VAFHFVSDVHLRLDRPDRARRFADWVNSVGPDDTIYVAGDLCDFWFASRQWTGDPRRCPGLAALMHHRERGGRVRVLLGNHDATLGPFFRDRLGVEAAGGPVETFEVFGRRIRVEHGHLAGTRNPWKGLMESQAFRRGFGLFPEFVASRLESALDRSNDVHRAAADARHLREFRAIADGLRETADLVVFGHSHVVHDELRGDTRLIILGDWLNGESFLRIDERGACFCADRPVLSSTNFFS